MKLVAFKDPRLSDPQTERKTSLFTLPPEIRQQIYHHLFNDEELIPNLKIWGKYLRPDRQANRVFAITTTCKTIRWECLPIAYAYGVSHVFTATRPEKVNVKGSTDYGRVYTRVEDSAILARKRATQRLDDLKKNPEVDFSNRLRRLTILGDSFDALFPYTPFDITWACEKKHLPVFPRLPNLVDLTLGGRQNISAKAATLPLRTFRKLERLFLVDLDLKCDVPGCKTSCGVLTSKHEETCGSNECSASCGMSISPHSDCKNVEILMAGRREHLWEHYRRLVKSNLLYRIDSDDVHPKYYQINHVSTLENVPMAVCVGVYPQKFEVPFLDNGYSLHHVQVYYGLPADLRAIIATSTPSFCDVEEEGFGMFGFNEFPSSWFIEDTLTS